MRLLARLFFIVIVLPVVYWGTSCSHRPEHVIESSKMTDILVDVHKAEGLLEVQSAVYPTDADKQEIVTAVLAKHGVTRAEYDSSLVWYSTHLKDFIRVYDRVKEILQAEDDSLTALLNIYYPSVSGDTVDLWQGKDYYLLDKQRLSSLWTWEMVADSTFWSGDSLEWKFDVAYMPVGHYGVVALTLRYDKDSARTKTELVDTAGNHLIGLRADSTLLLKSIVGSFNLLVRDDSIAEAPLGVKSIELMRYHTKK